MISKSEIIRIAKARLSDSKILFEARRFDGAAYICGYAVELALKYRICKTLKWDGFPSTNSEFNEFRSFKTHNLNVLLSLSGVEGRIKTMYFTEWSAISIWNPEVRYYNIGTVSEKEANIMIDSAKKLLEIL